MGLKLIFLIVTRALSLPGWAGFLRSQARGILALDFFTAGLLNGTKIYVLAVIEHGTRRIRILGATGHPVQSWVVQQARNLLMDLEDVGTRAKFVLHDRDASFTAAFGAVFQAAGVRIVRSAIQTPRMTVLREYEDFYNTRRPHRTAEPSRAAPPAARWHHRPGPLPRPPARPRRRRDS